jgi:cyclophilin family peptidyl-prolyl cis-trans isomerase
LTSDSNRPRPRSSKKRRAVQTGGNAASGAARSTRPATQPARAGAMRGGPVAGGIPTAWWAIGAVVVFAIGVALAGGAIKLGGGASPSSDPFADGTDSAGAAGGSPSGAVSGRVSIPPIGSSVARGTNCPTTEPPAATGAKRVVTIETAKGKIEVTVDPALGPRAAGNFVALASCGFYDGVVFHRVVPGFVIQGGDPTGTGSGGPGYEFADDPVTVPYTRGVVAMANSGPNTNGSQFFIVLADTGLPPSYSVFGHVTAGMDAVDAIAAAGQPAPGSGVVMDKVTVSNP